MKRWAAPDCEPKDQLEIKGSMITGLNVFFGWIDEDKHQERNDWELPLLTASAVNNSWSFE
jgi:hypothetical protein